MSCIEWSPTLSVSDVLLVPFVYYNAFLLFIFVCDWSWALYNFVYLFLCNSSPNNVSQHRQEIFWTTRVLGLDHFSSLETAELGCMDRGAFHTKLKDFVMDRGRRRKLVYCLVMMGVAALVEICYTIYSSLPCLRGRQLSIRWRYHEGVRYSHSFTHLS